MVGDSAFLPNSGAVVTTFRSDDITIDSDETGVQMTPKKEKNNPVPKEVEFMRWGPSNDLPINILKQVYPSVQISSNVNFNASMTFGDGIMLMKKVRDKDGTVKFVEQLESEQPAVWDFIHRVNYPGIAQEAANDLAVFSQGNVALNFSLKKELVGMQYLDQAYSRVSKMKDGRIQWHGFSYSWHKGSPEDVSVSALLDDSAPLQDILVRLGMAPGSNGKSQHDGFYRYVLPIRMPVPGRVYYPRSFWWSIFDSGWNDIMRMIPEAKKALMTNKLHIAYMVYISDRYWKEMFEKEKITDPEKQKERQKELLQQLEDFLSGAKNAGKTIVIPFKFNIQKGIEEKDIMITPLSKGDSKEGGDWIDDNEEATNMACYAMGVHPSLIGASPGKNKSINGTEARELFIIKQAMMRPVREKILLPLYIAKKVNRWDPDLHFVIPNIMLETLDKGTGQTKQIGNQKV